MLSKLLFLLRSASVCILSLLASSSLAQTINVGPGQPYTTIQSGINAAVNGDTVLVAPGTYNENINFNGKAITVTSSGGAAATIIDGGGTAGVPVVIFNSHETRSSVLSNFTIQDGGNATLSSNEDGGVWVGAASPTILNNTIVNNACVNVTVGGPTLFQGNTVGAVNTSTYSDYCSFWGSGLYVGGVVGNDPTVQLDIIGNIIENNGGVVNFGGNGNVFIGNILRNNRGSEGAVYISNTTNFIFINNLVYGNQAGGVSQYPQGAGGMTILVPGVSSTQYSYYGIIANNTFANNMASPGEYAATQLFLDGDISSFIVSNNIFYGSGTLPALSCDGVYSYLSGPATFSHNDAYNPSGPAYDSSCGTAATNGNISKDPLFSNAAGNDFHLTAGSPLIDTGDNSVIGSLSLYAVSMPTDFAGSPRLQNVTGTPCAIIDIGAYEYPGVVNGCLTSETLLSSLNPSVSGQSVTFTAQLTSANGVPTGDVQFSDGSTILSTQPISSTGGSAFTTNSLAIGSHAITAAYQPTGAFDSAAASLTQVVNGYPTTTTLPCSTISVSATNTAVLIATVNSTYGTPSGFIAFTDNTVPLGTQPLVNGTASLSLAGQSVGTHAMIATYIPTGAFGASSATCVEVITGLPTTSVLTVAPSTSTFGSPVTLSATVSPSALPGPSTPVGTVTFYNGANAIGTGTLAGGVATLTPSTLPVGIENLTCSYGGSSIYATSNCNIVPVTVTAATTALTLSSSNNPAGALSPVTFTARLTVNGQSTGAGNTIVLSVAGQMIDLITDSTGSATYTISTLPPNSYPVAANFTATNSLLGSSASLTEVISAVGTTTNITVAPNPAYFGQSVTMTATVSSLTAGAPAGSVGFFDGSTLLGTQAVSSSGVASFTTSTLNVGTHPITATFAPSTTVFVASSSSIVNEVILASGFTITLSPAKITLPPGGSGTVAIQLGSVGNFTGPLALTYGTLPAYATASINPATVTLAAGGTGTSTLTLNTLLKASNSIPPKPGLRELPITFAVLTLLLVPSGFSRRKMFNRLFALALLAGTLQVITGCTNSWYTGNFVAAGTYQVPVTATDINHNSQTAMLTVIVTP